MAGVVYLFDDVLIKYSGQIVGGGILGGLLVYYNIPRDPQKTIKKVIKNKKIYIDHEDDDNDEVNEWPKIISCQDKDYGYYLRIAVPEGITDHEFLQNKYYFEFKLRAITEIFERNGEVHMMVRDKNQPKTKQWKKDIPKGKVK
ncbi:hypothetical protein [Natranaerofaba carboxydovora]|uniref:hypothetical protein n=1 Tax=Natranaerofaba carboxydovora TaxID=2742683 RepID=UPI001F1466F0|nr:hypothetical protein [Natranaerofaba carboxydovora]